MEKDKDIIEIIVDEPRINQKAEIGSAIIKDDRIVSDEEAAEDDEIISGGADTDGGDSWFKRQKNKVVNYFKEMPNDLSPLFIKISCVVIVLIIAGAAFGGVFIPKSDEQKDKSLQRLRTTDLDYLAAKGEIDLKRQQIDDLSALLKEREAQRDEFRESQNNINKISDSNDALENEKKSLQDEIIRKQSRLASLETSLHSVSEKTVTWSSGDYTVGEDISAGTYTVTGTGSIVIANSGRAIVNTTLKSSGTSYTLNQDDKIHIDGNAKLVPEQ